MSSVLLTMRTRKNLRGDASALAFLEALNVSGDFFIPQRYGDHEPARRVFDPSDTSGICELWSRDFGFVLLKRQKPYPAWMSVRLWPKGTRRFNEILGGFDERYFRDQKYVRGFIPALQRLQAWGAFDHAYACHESNWEQKNYLGKPTEVTNGRVVSSGGLWIEDQLPGIYWANVFGVEYVRFFGEARIASAPAFHLERFPDGSYLLITGENPVEFESIKPNEEKVMIHLGRDAFFEKSNPKKPPKAPKFVFQDDEKANVSTSAGQDRIAEAIQDADRFVGDAPTLAEEFVKRNGPNFDYAVDSLSLVDLSIRSQADKTGDPFASDEGKKLLREATAYYGEVFVRQRGARWKVARGSTGLAHPVLEVPTDRGPDVEFPFVQVFRLWAEKNGDNGLSARYHSIVTGRFKTAGEAIARVIREAQPPRS